MQKSVLEKSVNAEGQTQLNQYTLLSEIGRGSFGKVKLASKGREELFVRIVH
jgi:[calcium/calmodulin-dependent protein kinase] kinase